MSTTKAAPPAVKPKPALDDRTHPSYHVGRGMVPTASGGRKRYMKMQP